MPRIIHSIHLSDYQARTMLIVQQAPSPELAFVEMGKQDSRIEQNLLGARDVLAKLGLLEIGPRELVITPEGEKVMQDEYLIDEMGELTEKGSELLQQDTEEPTPGEGGPTDAPIDNNQGAEMSPVTAGGEMETNPAGVGESSLLKLINDLVKLQG